MAKAHAAPRANSAAEPWFDWTEPADEPEPRPAPPTARRPPAQASARRRRAQHYARRRRDLLVDGLLALVLTIVLISLTAGLGILLLVVLPIAAGLVAHRVIQRRRLRHGSAPRRRSRGARRRPARG